MLAQHSDEGEKQMLILLHTYENIEYITSDDVLRDVKTAYCMVDPFAQ